MQIPFDPYDFFGYLASGLVVIVGMDLALGFPHVLGVDLKPVDGVFLVLAAYVSGQLIASPAKALFADLIVRKGLGAPSVNLFRRRRRTFRKFIFPGFHVPLPTAIQDRVLAKAGIQNPHDGESLFLAVRFSSRVLGDDRLLKRLDDFRNKYGFARNLAFASLLVGLAVLVRARLDHQMNSVAYGVTALVAGVLLFVRYLKVFRQYSYEMFNVFASESKEK